jgi:hypothetical protein
MFNMYNFRFELTCSLGYFSSCIRSSRVFLLYKEFTGFALSFAELRVVNFGLWLLLASCLLFFWQNFRSLEFLLACSSL